MAQVIVTMQNGAIEQVDFPTVGSESIMRVRIAYYVVCMYSSWQYVSWNWQGKLQILKREESK